MGRTVAAWWRGGAPAWPLRVDMEIHPTLRLEEFAAIYDQIQPIWLALVREPLANPEIAAMVGHATRAGAVVTLVTDGVLLDPTLSHWLLEAGLRGLRVVGAPRKGVRNVERLVAMRDARRLPGPIVEFGKPERSSRFDRWYVCRIDADGEVHPSAGNVHHQRFADIWNGERMRTARGRRG